jgi:trk system potassium uptake protein TrkH
MIFLPLMRVGGMQFFRTEGFDTMGKIRPRAIDIAGSLWRLYATLTVACALTYLYLGMTPLDAAVHAMATLATGGFSPSDSSFGKYPGAAEYAGAFFMILASLPFIRFLQLVAGNPRPLYSDPQVRAYLTWISSAVGALVVYRLMREEGSLEEVLRHTLFNTVSIFSGTGFSSDDVAGWGPFAEILALFIGLIGGCSSSTSGALSVFRVQVVIAAVRSRILLIHSPSRIAPVRYDGRTVEDEVLAPIILYATGYILIIGVLSVVLTLFEIDLESAIMGVWTSLGNIGYGFGPMVASSGTFHSFPEPAKWILIAAMLMGRLGLLSVLVLVLPRFWRA